MQDLTPPFGGPFTLAHVTHEAVKKMGGIGTVLEGMMTGAVYQSAVRRSILVGPMGGHHFESPLCRLGPHVNVRYSSADHIDFDGLGRKFHPIQWAFGVHIAYGIRTYEKNGHSRDGSAEVLLIDVSNPNREQLAIFKMRLWNEFGIDARRYEHDWGFEEYCRLAEPAYYALSAIIPTNELPCIILSHEFMGLCTALKAVMDGGDAFRTIFHAHECATARRLVEHQPGHDSAFYNMMRQAAAEGLFVEDVFGDQSGFMRHALISRAHELDAIIAVGDPTAEEMRFLNPETRDGRVQLVYNGLPTFFSEAGEEAHSRRLMDEWAQRVIGYRPDVLMTHVARPVISKGFWRDLKVLSHLEPMLGAEGRTGLLIILTCGAPPRSIEQANRMAREYGWPWHHRDGYPDLAGPEIELHLLVKHFNAGHTNIKVMLVNQFGWSRETLGDAAAEGMSFTTLRQAADVEFGQSVYEPFGIAQFEPLGSGAICVASSVCGCVTSYQHVLERLGPAGKDFKNVIVAEYTVLDRPMSIDELRAMTQQQRDKIEERVAAEVAAELFARLPRNEADAARLLKTGGELADGMSWDTVMAEGMIPLLSRVVARSPRHGGEPAAHLPAL